MERTPFKFLSEFFFGPQAAAGLVGLIGLYAYFLTEKKLKKTLEEDDFTLASSNSIGDGIFAAFLIIQACYGVITTIFVLLHTWGHTEEMLFFYTWVRFDDIATWNAKISLVGLFFGGLLYSFGFLLSAMNYLNISKLKFDSRSKLITGEFTARDEPSPSQTDEERTEPVTFSEILEALDAQLKEAIEEAHDLREELEETKSKVITLEEEVQGKDILIGEIEASKTALSQQIEHQDEEKVQDEKKLSLTDSVMVGDSIMGGMKIDQQINNDPDAIARAVIAAYRAGREDKE